VTGLLHDAVVELRESFPRTQIAALVARMAAFPDADCWASTSYLARQIGRSTRQVFRYFRQLKDAGLLDRVPGSRDPHTFPERAERPWALRAHGYSRTVLRGWLGPWVHQRRQVKRDRDGDRERSRQRKADAKAERVARKRREHEQWYRERFPELAKRADRDREPRNRPGDPPPYASQMTLDVTESPAASSRATGPPE
jgi:hypothetical protein